MQVFVGGTRDPELATSVDGAIQAARTELQQTLGITAEPSHVRAFEHPTGIPQYTVGHSGRVQAIEAAIAHQPGLYWAGTSLHGVGINAATTQAELIASQIVDELPISSVVREVRSGT